MGKRALLGNLACCWSVMFVPFSAELMACKLEDPAAGGSGDRGNAVHAGHLSQTL